MKKQLHYNLFKIILIAISLISVASCTDTKKPEAVKDVAEEYKEAKYNNTDKEKDARFLVEATEINLGEIQLGQLAQQNSNMSEVRALGEMIEKEHRESLTNLTALADKKMLTLPTSLTDDAEDVYTKLNKKSGSDFDKDYCELMIKGHKKAIALFENASTDCPDSEIREWALSTLPILRTHLYHSTICHKKCETMELSYKGSN